MKILLKSTPAQTFYCLNFCVLGVGSRFFLKYYLNIAEKVNSESDFNENSFEKIKNISAI
jgi:hypothetical protein